MKYINWKNIMTALVLLAITGGIPTGWNWASDKVKRIDDLEQKVEQLQDVKELKEAVQQLAVEVIQMKKNQLTITGVARVQHEGDTSCIRINTQGRAATFASRKRARITNLSHPDTPSTVVDIGGTFRNSDSNYVAVVSGPAASLIEAGDQSTIDIRIEPEE